MLKNYFPILLFCFTLSGCSKDEIKLQEETTATIYTLPIVVHIIHIGEEIGKGYNLSNERVVNQIKTLNDDFRKKQGTLGYNTHPLGADTKIEFKFAEKDPYGNPTNGIQRVNLNDVIIDSEKDWFFDELPYYGYWNKLNYINVWVFPFDPNTTLGQSSVPKVDLPGLRDANADGTTGILISTPHFGTSNLSGGSNLGRTLTHEMGHFLGLEHLWGKLENAHCLEFDDYCDDTPPVSRRTGNCSGSAVSFCNNEPVLTQNYMDYTNDTCMNMFTKDQVARMRYVIKNSTVRSTLINSTAITRN